MTNNKKCDPEVEIIYTGNLSFEEQLQRINIVNDIFVDIAAAYCIDKIKNNKLAENANNKNAD